MGAFVDLSNSQPAVISDNAINNILIEDKLEMEYLSRKVKLPDSLPNEQKPIPVLKSHIDLYNHVNNAKYVMIASDLLPAEFQTKRLRVEYRTPAKQGDVFYPLLYNVDDKVTVSLNNQIGKAFAIVEFWKKN